MKNNKPNFKTKLLTEDKVIRGVAFKAGTEIIFNNFGGFDIVCPSSPVDFYGTITAGNSWIMCHPNGRLKYITLGEERTLGNYTIPAGSRIECHQTDDGTLKSIIFNYHKEKDIYL